MSGVPELLFSWEKHLRAEGKSKATVKAYGDSIHSSIKGSEHAAWRRKTWSRSWPASAGDRTSQNRWPSRSTSPAGQAWFPTAFTIITPGSTLEASPNVV